MCSQRSLVIILYFINFTFQCESRTISDGSEIKDIGESNNSKVTNNATIIEEQLKDAETSMVKRVETAVTEEQTAGQRRLRKLWNKLGKINDREKRGLLKDPYGYNLGPIFQSSGEYDSDGPPSHHGHGHREYYYPPPPSSHEESHSDEHPSYGPYLPPHHDHPQPGYSLTPPTVEHEEKPAEEPDYAPYPPAQEHHHHPEPEDHPYPPAEEHHHHPEPEDRPYPPAEEHHHPPEPEDHPYPPAEEHNHPEPEDHPYPPAEEHNHPEPEDHPYPPAEEHHYHPEPEDHPYPPAEEHHHHPEEVKCDHSPSEEPKYKPYPPAEESSYVLYPPHSPPEQVHKTEVSNLKPNKELLAIAEKQIDQDMLNMHTKTNLKPNKALLDISIAEKHMREGKLETHYGPPSTSYGVPVSSKEEHKETSVETHYIPPSTSYGVPVSSKEEHKNVETHYIPPPTSYGIPVSSVPNPSHEIQPPHETIPEHKSEEAKTSPATSYGIPDAKIEQTFSKERPKEVKEKSKSHSNSVAVNEARPYDLHSSSYGAPQKSVTSFTSQSTNIKPFFTLPDDSNRSYRFNSRNTNSINEIDGAKKKRETKYVMIPMDKFSELTECMHKSLSSAYTLKIEDGTLIKE